MVDNAPPQPTSATMPPPSNRCCICGICGSISGTNRCCLENAPCALRHKHNLAMFVVAIPTPVRNDCCNFSLPGIPPEPRRRHPLNKQDDRHPPAPHALRRQRKTLGCGIVFDLTNTGLVQPLTHPTFVQVQRLGQSRTVAGPIS